MASAAKDRLRAEKETLKQYQEQLVDLQKAKDEVVKEVTDKWSGIADNITEITIRANKTDIFSEIFGVIWLPYYIADDNGRKIEFPAFKR